MCWIVRSGGRKYKRSGRLWHNWFFSTVVDEEVYLWAVVRYIEHNPVRVGLVQRAEDYRWSSCNAHVSGFTKYEALHVLQKKTTCR
jgi:hypothetical protein